MGFSVDIDTGGTFTDGFFSRGDEVKTAKVPTTPHDLTVCFLECIKEGAARFGMAPEDFLHATDIIRFSSTIGTNALIQRDGSKLGLLVTAGREDLAPTDAGEGTAPLVERDMVIGLEESVSPEGQVVLAPDEPRALEAAQELIDRGARCLVVAFSNSERNPANERLVQRAIKREYPRDYLGSVPVFLSSNVSILTGDQQRVNAAVINAYIHDKLARALYKAGEDLRLRLYSRCLFIGHSNGCAARVAKTRAINTYNSGPAAGLLGARTLGQLYESDTLITADMGGTSFDVGYIRDGEASYSLHPVVEGLTVNVPMMSMRVIGAGGGSIASVIDGRLQVGPQSAGALPGPACFDLGGSEPTVTDANLVLGILDPDYFLGGKMRLNREKATKAIADSIAAPLGLSVEEAALQIKQTVDGRMALEVGELKQELGREDPLLVVYGGGGPGHCCDIARQAGVSRIVATPFSAVFSAFGSSTLDVGHLYYRRVDARLDEESRATFGKAVEAMRAEAERDLRGEGFAGAWTVSAVELFVGSEDSSLKVQVDVGFADTAAAMGAAAQTVSDALAAGGSAGSDHGSAPVVTVIGLKAEAPVPHYVMAEAPAAGSRTPEPKSTRPVYLGGDAGRPTVPVFGLGDLRPGDRTDGPALVESEDTTFLVQPGWTFRIDGYGNCLLEGGEQQ